MNRTLQKQYMRRHAMRMRGGGYSVGTPLVPFAPANDWNFAVKAAVNTPYSDCGETARFGQLVNQANPALAQAAWPLKGGRRRRTERRRRQRGAGCGCGLRRGRTQRGGAGGFSVNPEINVGGSGPNAAPVYAAVPCDARAGTPNPLNPQMINPDPRAPADLYSLTPNQSGGGTSGAPGSMIPVYHADSAGFRFEPSTAAGAALPDGVTAFNEVVPVAARLGGGRRRRRTTHRRKTHRRRTNRRSNRR
jgi:hypothetical protein